MKIYYYIYKNRYRLVKSRKCITLLEILISSVVLGLFSISLFLVHSHLSKYSKTTFWKQEKMKHLEIFVKKLQKSLEEATNELQRETLNNGNWRIISNPRPLLYISSPDRSGKIMAWKKDKLDVQTGVKNTITGYLLYDKNKRKLTLESSDNSTKGYLTDVEKITIKATSIKQIVSNTNNSDLYKEGIDIISSDVEVTGSLLEIYFQLTPNDPSIPRDVKLEQNAKFKLIIGALESNNIHY